MMRRTAASAVLSRSNRNLLAALRPQIALDKKGNAAALLKIDLHLT
jgi:hypothetical protein